MSENLKKWLPADQSWYIITTRAPGGANNNNKQLNDLYLSIGESFLREKKEKKNVCMPFIFSY